MDAFLLVLALLGGLGGAAVWYSTQMKKNYLVELEKALPLEEFEMTGSMGKALVEGRWKGRRVSIEAQPSGPGLPSSITYRIQGRSTFTADIKPGEGLAEHLSSREGERREEPTFRPWRVQLTAEEEALIKSRAGQEAETPKERFRVVSPKPEETARLLGQPDRAEAVTSLFSAGVGLVQVGFGEVVAVKSPYTVEDLQPRQVSRVLQGLRRFQGEDGADRG